MKQKFSLFVCLLLVSTAIAGRVALASQAVRNPSKQKGWRDSFPVDKKTLRPEGNNLYFVLEPGLRLHYKGGTRTLTRSVLPETKTVDGVPTRVIEDREVDGGQLVEVARDYFAVESSTNDVYYFGEEVDLYEKGKVVSHTGTWLSGVGGARFGLMMPGQVKLGDKFYQELHPNTAMDRSEIVGVGEAVATPAGRFENCVQIEETSPLEKGPPNRKWYAPGVGMVRDNEFVLVKIERARR